MSFDFEDTTAIPTEGYVKAAAIVDGGERAVYYVEDTGMVHMADFDDLDDLWTDTMGFTVTGEMALTPRSDVLLVASGRGVITAFQVAEIPVTESPSDMPSDYPSMEPTLAPTLTKAPVESTEAPTSTPTLAPVAPVTPPTLAPDTPEPPAKPVMPEPAPLPVSEVTPEAPTAPSAGNSIRSLFAAFVAIVLATMMM